MLVFILIVFCIGIVCGEIFRANFILPWCLALVFIVWAAISLHRPRVFDCLLAMCIFFCAMAAIRNAYSLSDCHILKIVSPKNDGPYLLEGFVATEPEIKDGICEFVLQARKIKSRNFETSCWGSVLVRLESRDSVKYGSYLALKGRPERTFHFRRGYRQYLWRRGIFLAMRISSSCAVAARESPAGFSLKKFSIRLKENIKKIFGRYLSGVTRGILEAMVLGERRNIPVTVNDSMVKSGTVHILVVSGFNVGIVAFIISLMLKILRLRRRLRILLAIFALAIYCLMTGSSTPVVRATIMAAVIMSGYLFRREPDILNSLALAALFILAPNPRQFFDIGFQLSFASVIAIITLYPFFLRLFRITSIKIKLFRFILEGCLVSFSAWLATAGLVAYYFRVFSPVTVLANLFIVPLASLITLCGFGLVLASFLSPLLAGAFASATQLAVALLLKVNLLLLKLPGAYLYL